MVLQLAAVLNRIAVDVSLAFVAFFVGFAGAMLYARHSRGTAAPPAPPDKQPSPEGIANEIARAAMAAQQLRDLAKNVASDVGAHNTLVEGISGQLESLGAGGLANSAVVVDAVSKMLEANKKLAARLEDAEQKIQTQAEEIRTQQSEARTDALTKLANRRAFDAFLAECQDRFLTDGRPYSLLLFDVDHFKRFNDTHGHQAGDEVLRVVARTLTRTTKTGDLACRYGGEEFAVILVGAQASDAQAAAERVRKAIEGMKIHYEGASLHVTASVGVADCRVGDDAAHVTRRADEAVYASKKGGRNCSHWHNGQFCQRLSSTPPAPKQNASSEPLPEIAPEYLSGRGTFAAELGRRIAESHRFGFPVSLLYFRIKSFKKLQNTYGNAVGDLLVDSLAAFIQSTLRDMDLLGRLDDGELIVMLPGSTDSAAKIVGQRVKTSICLCPIPLGDQQIRLELDMGVWAVQPGENSAHAMASARNDMETAAAAPPRESSPFLPLLTIVDPANEALPDPSAAV